MKIKEVIAQTELTDRAIRLYIENGLITPSCNESYSGRKSLNFSESDVENLQKIATLRKTGFSLAEIKRLQKDAEECRNTLSEFIDRTTERIEADTVVVNLLKPLLKEETVSMNNICDNLNGVTAEKQIPDEDIKPSLLERIERIFFLTVAGIGIVLLILWAVYMIWHLFIDSPYIYRTPNEIFYFLVSLAMYILAVSVYYIHNYKKHKKIKSQTRRRIISAILLIIMIPVIYFEVICTILTLIAPCTYSHTDNPSNYLKLDHEFGSSFFPESIPDFARDENNANKFLDSTKYYYQYAYDMDLSTVDIVAEWKYPQTDYYITQFKDEIEYYNLMKGNDDQPAYEITKGDWICLYYCDTDESDFPHGYIYKIFAYNEKTYSVRYIYSASEGPCGSCPDPYYVSMDW